MHLSPTVRSSFRKNYWPCWLPPFGSRKLMQEGRFTVRAVALGEKAKSDGQIPKVVAKDTRWGGSGPGLPLQIDMGQRRFRYKYVCFISICKSVPLIQHIVGEAAGNTRKNETGICFEMDWNQTQKCLPLIGKAPSPPKSRSRRFGQAPTSEMFWRTPELTRSSFGPHPCVSGPFPANSFFVY